MPSRKQHDKLFKQIAGNPDDAAVLIRESLPEEILSKLDVESLSPLRESFIDAKLSPHFYDLVYSCPFKDKTKRDIKITVLIEHKSYKSRHIHLQLLRYMLNIWEDELEQDLPLSMVIPLVIYHGKTKWEAVPFRELFPGYDEQFAAYLPDFSFEMEDIKKKELENILQMVKERSAAGILYLLFKYQGTKLFTEMLPLIFRTMQPLLTEEGNRNRLSGFLHYVLYETDLSWEEVIDLFRQQIPQGDDAMLSTAEQLIQKGRKEGLEQGLEQGSIETSVAVARRLKALKVPTATITEATGISAEQLEKL